MKTRDHQNKRTGIGCVRVSTDRQERSIEEQKESIRAAAARDGVALLEGRAWCEDEGVSGSILDRPGLQKLLALCRTRKDITDVYFWKRNRLSRSIDPLDGLNIEREIEHSGKRVHFVQGMQKTGNRLLDFIASGLEYAQAGQYLVNLSSDTIRGLVPLTKAGFDAGRPTPYGFDRMVVDSSGRELYRIRDLGNGVRHKTLPDGHVQVYEKGTRPAKDKAAHSTFVLGDPVRVAVVRRIFDSYARQEKGMRTIINELNDEGIPSPRGGAWSLGTIRSMLVNPVYYGANVWNVRSFSKYHRIVGGAPAETEETSGRTVHFNDRENWIVADDGHGFEPIISKEFFELAQARRLKRNRPYSRGKSVVAPYYLSGLTVCTCGHRLQGQTKTSGKRKGYRKYHYYVCGGFRMKGKTVCRQYSLPKEALEAPVIAALSKRLKALGRIESIREQVKALLAEHASPDSAGENALRRRIRAVDERMAHWQEAIEKGLNLDLAAENLNRLAREKEGLEGELALARERENMNLDLEEAAREVMAGLDRMQEVLDKGSVAEVKAALRAYIGRIEYDPETNRARVGFLRGATRATLLKLAPQTARISMVAGAGFEPATSGL